MLHPAIKQIDRAIAHLKMSIENATTNTFTTKASSIIVEDAYTQVVVGLHVRQLSTDRLHESELQFAPKITALLKAHTGDFVIMKFSAGCMLGEHFHLNDVHFVCLTGAFSTDGIGTIIRAGSELSIPAGTVHKFIGVENGLVVAIFKKK